MPDLVASENEWTKFSAEDTQKFISEVRSKDFPALFDCSHYELFKKPLGFYDGYSLYALSNQIMIPFYEMYYLSNGENHQYLDGTIFAFQALNNLEAIALREDNVEAYLAFYFSNIYDPACKINFITDPRKNAYSSARAMRHHFQAIQHHNARLVYYRDEERCFYVRAPLLYNGETVQGEIVVSRMGVITVKSPMEMRVLDNSIDDAVPSYLHPHEKQILEENRDILHESAEGRRLLGTVIEHNIKLRIVAGIPHCGFALNKQEVFIVVPAYQERGNEYQAIDMAIGIKECEQFIVGDIRPEQDKESDLFYKGHNEANLDTLLNLCIIAEECKNQGQDGFLKTFRKMGFGPIYSGYKDKIGIAALFERYLDIIYKN